MRRKTAVAATLYFLLSTSYLLSLYPPTLMCMIVFCFEHLPACSLGCYGEWNIDTAEFDALASRSWLFENLYASPATGSSLLHYLAEQSAGWSLIHSDGLASELAKKFANVESLPPGEIPTADQLHNWWPQGDSANLCVHFAAAEPEWEELEHLAKTWPQTDPQQVSSPDPKEPRTAVFKEEISPDWFSRLPEWKQHLLSHAASVQQCNRALGAWLELLENLLKPGDLIVLSAASGDRRRIVNNQPEWLCSVNEVVTHLPLMIYCVDQEVAWRISGLVSIEQIAVWLPHLTATSFKTFPEIPAAESLTYRSELAQGWRTKDWLLIERLLSANDSSESPEEPELRLYRKPDDCWEVYDLAGQFPDLIESYRSRGHLGDNPDGD